MTAPPAEQIRSRAQTALLVAGFLLIAINLRPALASVGPLVTEIRAETGLSNAALGLLTTLPLLAFGVVSVGVSAVTRVLGMGGALASALLLLTLGTGIRAAGGTGLLFAGTILLGIGIALGNVLLPSVVRRDFPHRSALMTSLYSSLMALGAAMAAGVSVPLSAVLGWRGSLAVWAVPAAIALILWLPQVDRHEASRARLANAGLPSFGVARSGLAWQIALFLGLQSLTFYVILAWLPDLLQSRGFTATEAGWMLSLSQAAGIGGSATIPLWAGRVPDQRMIVGLLGLMEVVALGGLLFASGFGVILFLVSLLGFVLGGTFGLALLLLVLRTPNAETTTRLSGMAQSIGYLVAAAGPVAFGMLYDLSAGWTVPMLFLFVVLGGKVVAGIGAGRPGEIGGVNGR